MPRVKPHAKIHTSLGNHRKTADVFADNHLLATYTRLILLAVERYADRNGNTFTIHESEVCRITGRGRADVARRLLARLADVSPICAEPDGNIWRITVPNFAIKQGFTEKNGAGTEYPPTPTPTTTPTPTPKKKENAPSGARSLVLERWSEVKEAASMYGREWRGEKPSEARISVMAARVSEETDPSVPGRSLVHAVHGYMAFHRIVSGDYDPMSHFAPETIFRASKFEKYVEAYDAAIAIGLSPPFERVEPKAPESFAQKQENETLRWFKEMTRDPDDQPRSAIPGNPVPRLSERGH